MGEKKALPAVPLLAASVLVLYAAFKLVHVRTPFALALAFAYILNPTIIQFESRGLKRGPVVAAIYLLALGAIALLMSHILPWLSYEWARAQNFAPTAVLKTQEFMMALPKRLNSALMLNPTQVEEWSKALYEPTMHQMQRLPGLLLGLFPVLSLLFLVPFISFFFVLESKNSVTRMIQACPSRYVEQALYLLAEIDTSLGNYLRGILLEAFAVGMLAYAGLWMLGLSHTGQIAVLAGVSSFVPYLGAAVGAAVGAVAALIQFGTLGAAMKVILLFAGVRFIDDWFLQPIITKHSVRLHPLAFLLSLMIGGQVFGFIGLVFAVPAACVVKSLVKVAWDWYESESFRENFEHIETGITPYT